MGEPLSEGPHLSALHDSGSDAVSLSTELWGGGKGVVG